MDMNAAGAPARPSNHVVNPIVDAHFSLATGFLILQQQALAVIEHFDITLPTSNPRMLEVPPFLPARPTGSDYHIFCCQAVTMSSVAAIHEVLHALKHPCAVAPNFQGPQPRVERPGPRPDAVGGGVRQEVAHARGTPLSADDAR